MLHQPHPDLWAGFRQPLSPLPFVFLGAELGEAKYSHLTMAPCDGRAAFPSPPRCEPTRVSFEMNEWERERRRINTLQAPGEGNAGAASSPGSIARSKGCAFHIPAGLSTPGCRMLWAGVSTYSLSVHDQKFPFVKTEVGANPSQCIGIFPPPKAFHKSFPAHSLLWPLKAVSVTQSCFSSWSHQSWVQLCRFQWHLICMDECFNVYRYM